MRIAYYAPLSEGARGVKNKIAEQISAWRRMGCTVKLFVYTASRDNWKEKLDEDWEIIARGRLLQRLSRVSLLCRKIIQWGPDIVYMRFEFFYPPIGSLMKKIPTVLEVNSDDLAEYRAVLPLAKWLYHRATRGRTLAHAAGIVSVTEEIRERLALGNAAVAVISNGIDLSKYPVLPVASGPPRLVFIGWEWTDRAFAYQYHGIEKVLRLAKLCPDWGFDIVGYHSPGNEPGNVVFHGPLERRAYEAIFERAQVAIGPLALHVKGMNEACPLKVREYLAYGIPTIIGYRDTDFPKRAAFLLQLPNTPSNVDDNVDRIKGFVAAWADRRVPRDAIEHLDIMSKERERLRFFEQILTQRGAEGTTFRMARGRKRCRSSDRDVRRTSTEGKGLP